MILSTSIEFLDLKSGGDITVEVHERRSIVLLRFWTKIEKLRGAFGPYTRHHCSFSYLHGSGIQIWKISWLFIRCRQGGATCRRLHVTRREAFKWQQDNYLYHEWHSYSACCATMHHLHRLDSPLRWHINQFNKTIDQWHRTSIVWGHNSQVVPHKSPIGFSNSMQPRYIRQVQIYLEETRCSKEKEAYNLKITVRRQ